MSDVNDKNTFSSWLIQYLGSKNDDEFATTAVKLDYPMLTKKMDYITATVIWQESNISKKSQIIVLRHLSNFFGTRLVVPECDIDILGQNHGIPRCDISSITKILTILLEILYCQECSNKSESNTISTNDIVVCGHHG